MTATVAIVGRPNVGKSTLFNRLTQRRLALVDDTPGVTRDWREGEAQLGDLRFRVLDTAGLEEAERPAPQGEVAEPDAQKPLQLAVVGRPNVGKSTLVNRLIGEERLLTGPEAGITRDAIAVEWSWRGKRVRLIDTAGLRRKAKVEAKLEKLSVADTLRAIRFAEVVVLVLDGEQMLERQDLAIARLVEEEGRALVLAANKWDVVADKPKALERLRHRVEVSLPQLQGVVTVTLSAKTGRGMEKLMPAVFAAHAAWNRRIATPALNRWLEAAQARHPPPLVSGRRLKLRYMTQANIRPPTFALFA